MQHGEVEISREVEAIQIPSGERITLPAGLNVIITQSLGGTYTVATTQGLARISEKDADALGIDPNAANEAAEAAADLDPDDLVGHVWAQLKNVYDPEIPVNIVDLGLVYDCFIDEEGDKKTAMVKMTLTAPGCGMGPTIAADAQSRIMTINGIEDAHVDLVWEPAWNQDMISEEGKMKLGMI
ncbi:putative Fe-S cluster assembly protein SufT [Sulfuriroseicoccus oceanibius]|uniref:Putative Fe-S cluster assembly protein SufT n=1 Tax=Sulfuriroseicoccus oceanibius TaxID=2707525 RepID=A0A6B3LED0_9BACT|nr:putative Fe-S cluster assembly protein SufT [Sulfuriroseicoccus oceanibius]QQL44431.1 putative Fe-S cluster assembly protein SufT [Sulfuriroseicoccus oceanibius]